MATTKHTLIALVQDRPGVLNRIASMFRRRGFNMDSVAVGHSEVPCASMCCARNPARLHQPKNAPPAPSGTKNESPGRVSRPVTGSPVGPKRWTKTFGGLATL